MLFADSTEGITPTVGFLNSSFSLYRFNVTLFDVGGGARIRSIWKNYYAEVSNNNVIFLLCFQLVLTCDPLVLAAGYIMIQILNKVHV